MPLYEYECANCKVRQELIQSIPFRNEGPICTSCPSAMELVPSVPFRAIIVKGCTGAQLH